MDELTPQDRIAIDDLLSLHGHLVDDGDFDRLGDLLTPDAEYDVTAFGGGVMTGFASVREASLAMGTANPVGHHVTNILVTKVSTGPDGDVVETVSKGIGISLDGRAGSVIYEDVIRRTADGWRISRRTVIPRTSPLQR